MRKYAYCYRFRAINRISRVLPHFPAISKELFKLVGFAYVDDSDLLQTGSDPIAMLASMQELINGWSSLIDVTGGALSVEKSGGT